MQVEDEVLQRMEKGCKGKAVYISGNNPETLFINFADPNTDVDGERSSIKVKHPVLSEPAVRKALSLLIDRETIKKAIYGRARRLSANYVNGPDEFVSKNTSWEFSVEKASALLDESGWNRGADGIREKNGKKLKFVYQTTINGPRQKVQAVVKQACQKAGIEIELKSVVASVFFSSDVGNPDTYSKFYADLEVFADTMRQPDPGPFLNRFNSRNVAAKENKWQGSNFLRWVNRAYDAALEAAETETDPIKRAALYIKCNDLLWQDTALIPLMQRLVVHASSNSLRPALSGWTTATDNFQDWYRES
ncbi:ABC-type transport system substrate-binding protein [Bradyrhizobium sp. CIR3A]|nr:ABC-type transport system substrate-binding protein [Bradyrhizobium sp. CIR3A]